MTQMQRISRAWLDLYKPTHAPTPAELTLSLHNEVDIHQAEAFCNEIDKIRQGDLLEGERDE